VFLRAVGLFVFELEMIEQYILAAAIAFDVPDSALNYVDVRVALLEGPLQDGQDRFGLQSSRKMRK
jgi:hypothetical protein